MTIKPYQSISKSYELTLQPLKFMGNSHLPFGSSPFPTAQGAPWQSSWFVPESGAVSRRCRRTRPAPCGPGGPGGDRYRRPGHTAPGNLWWLELNPVGVETTRWCPIVYKLIGDTSIVGVETLN